MKIEKDNCNYTIYIVKEYLDYYDFNFSSNSNNVIKKMFNKINNRFNLELEGLYSVVVYINNDYGMIIEMEKDTDEYIKLFGDKLDMKIIFKLDCDFYYEDELGNYLYNNKLYSKNKNYESNIIYGKKIKDLLKVHL